MDRMKENIKETWKLIMALSPMLILVLLSLLLSLAHNVFSLHANTLSIIGLTATSVGLLAGLVGLFNLKSISKKWRFIVFLSCFPIVLFSLLLSGL